MKQAGCTNLSFGIESGSQKMLDSMNKMATVEQAKKAITAARQAGIRVHPAFMVGIPGESPETIKASVDFIKEMDLFVPVIFITNPYPGSEFYDYAKKKGLIKDEEAFVEKCGEAIDLNVNLTDMSDEKLLYWRSWAIHKAIHDYRRRHPLEAVRMDLRKIRFTLKGHGLAGSMKKAFNKIKRHDFRI